MSTPLDVALVLTPPFIPDEPHLGVALLASYLRANGFTVKVYDLSIRMFHRAPPDRRYLWDRSSKIANDWQQRPTVDTFLNENWSYLEEFLDELMADEPKVVGFTSHMVNAVVVIELVNILRSRKLPVKVVSGGPAYFVNYKDEGKSYELCMYGHPTLGKPELRVQMEKWFSLFDAIVLDEGEGPLLEICQRVRDGEDLEGVGNAVICRGPDDYAPLKRVPPIRDLSTIPFPTFEDFDLSKYSRPQLPVLFNRGCIKSCTCCTERYRWGKFRARKAEDVLAELKHHNEVLGINQFNACDMLLNANVRELNKLCDLIIENELQIGWGGNVVVRKEMSLELCTKMRQAGCSWLIYGIESGSPRIVDLIGKRFTLEEGERNLRNTHRAGIRTYINIIIGFPGETEADFQETMEYVRRNRANIDWIILMAMFELFHHTEVVLKPEQYNLRPEDVAGLVENFGLVEWSDTTGNTYEVRQYRFARMMELLAELGLPDPTMQGDDMRRSLVKAELLSHEGIHNMLSCALGVDPDLDTPLLEVLEDMLASKDERHRAGAARLIGMIESRRSVPGLLEVLHDPSPWVRGEAARALGRVADPTTVPYLEDILTDKGFEGLEESMQRNLSRLRRVFHARKKVRDFEAKQGAAGTDKAETDKAETDKADTGTAETDKAGPGAEDEGTPGSA